MSIELAERLKRELTDKYVVVADGVPELRRFRGRTGTVKTVNMNARALVQFDSPEDISWYDIDPAYLTVVDKPLPKKETAEEAHAPTAKPQRKPAAKAPAGKSPLELAREQAAAKAGGAKKPSPLDLARQQGAAKSNGDSSAPAQAAPQPGKKLSPLELARQQGAAKQEATADSAPAPASQPEAPAGKKLSPLELARMQGAAKR